MVTCSLGELLSSLVKKKVEETRIDASKSVVIKTDDGPEWKWPLLQFAKKRVTTSGALI